MNIRRKNRLWIACAVLAGLALTISLVLYALRSNIDLFYTPGEILYGKRETQQMPEVGQRLRVGGMVMPGSVKRDPQSLKVNFSIYDAEGVVDVTYEGILPDLFREGQGVVVQGELDEGNHMPRQRSAGETRRKLHAAGSRESDGGQSPSPGECL